MGFGVLFLLMLAASGWWLYSRWSELREAQARRREAEMMYVFEAKSRSAAAPATAAPPPASGFYPTLPGDG